MVELFTLRLTTRILLSCLRHMLCEFDIENRSNSNATIDCRHALHVHYMSMLSADVSNDRDTFYVLLAPLATRTLPTSAQ